jgi:hypothetical protein
MQDREGPSHWYTCYYCRTCRIFSHSPLGFFACAEVSVMCNRKALPLLKGWDEASRSLSSHQRALPSPPHPHPRLLSTDKDEYIAGSGTDARAIRSDQVPLESRV